MTSKDENKIRLLVKNFLDNLGIENDPKFVNFEDTWGKGELEHKWEPLFKGLNILADRVERLEKLSDMIKR